MVKKTTTAKKAAPKRNSKPTVSKKKVVQKRPSITTRVKDARNDLLKRRPHRSFKLTRRRDYRRSLKLPGNLAFTAYVFKHLKNSKRTFISLIFVMSGASMLLVGMASQDNFNLFSGLLSESSKDMFEGGWGEVAKGGLLLMSGITGGFSGEVGEIEQLFAVVIGLLVWLTTVWLVRAQLAGHSPKLRDGIYNAGAPIVSTGLVLAVLVLQLLPGILGFVFYNTALVTGLLSNGAFAMVAFIIMFLLILLTLYLVTSTLVALVMVALPGVYPWQAIKAAGDLVVGRRVRILLRLFWLALVVAVLWVFIMIPILLFSSWLQTTYEETSWVPIVPVAMLLLSTASVVFAGSYVYLLYRKVIDDDSPSA